MFENLKIRNRLGKAFRIIVTTCSIAAVLGVVMLIVTMTLYKNALNNYGCLYRYQICHPCYCRI